MTARTRGVVFVLNGKRVSLRVHPMKRLLDALREDCGLTGTKEGCGEGECGACTVLVDGRAVNSCLVPVAQAAGTKVVTIEGLRGRHPLQRAFAEHGGAQCGICTPGMIMAAAALGPRPTLDEVRTGLAGNICRCTGYEGIYRAIQKQEARSKKQEDRREKTEARSQKPEGRKQKAEGRSSTQRARGGPAKARIPNPESRVPKSDRRGRL
jgi:aerobic-type carbon monoxide dehydrogenase small subunit (CoxS/CutS family)